MPETVNIPKKSRTPVQSMYNIPATVNRSFARVEGNLASDLNQQRRELVQPKRRTPVISIFNLPATVGRLSSVNNMENFINWTPNNPDTQLPNSNNLLGTNSSPQINGQQESTANTATVSDTSFQRSCQNFLEYNGHSISKVQKIENIDRFFATYRRWYMFGGPSIRDSRIIPPPSRAWYVRRYNK
jgi:hypothetical protein